MESLFETFDDQECDFFSPFSPWTFFPSSLPFNFFRIWDWGCTLFSFPWLSFFLSTFLFGEGFATFALPTTFSAGSSGESLALPYSFRSVCLIIWVLYRAYKVWLTMIFLFRIIIWIILGYSRDTFEAFLRHKFSQNTNYKSLTVRFTNKVERGWRIGLHVKMSESSLENAVLDRRRFYELKFSSLKPLGYSANLI